ncbi:MAG: hypothetical protein COA79_24920 [Planctomycetota bacterium]|nr:MAG: hypothetical protein COA79_24920 [Planctomycetota bacterium]
METNSQEIDIPEEILLGNILLKNESISSDQLREALVLQEQSSTLSSSPGKEKTLGEILLSKGYITPDKLQRALRTQRANFKKKDFLREEKSARLLGKEAVDMGLLTYEQLEDCIVQQASKLENEGINQKLGEILVSNGFATQEQILELIEFQNGAPSLRLSKVLHNQGLGINLNLEQEHFASLDELIKNETPEEKHIPLSELGQGGNGKIILCMDSEIRRYVAMKVLNDLYKPSKVQQARFLEEIQITGQLEHPNIVPIHEVGVDKSGNLYFTMKHVTGNNLEEHIDEYYREDKKYDQRTIEIYLLNILMKICDAIKFAHSKGVIHRDIKPENIMIGEYGEVLLMDWGSAKVKNMSNIRPSNIVTIRKDTNVLNTVDGTMIGTPLYMSPEQAKGAINEYDIRTDIYGLGAVLFKMLTNHPPAKGETEEEVLKDVIYSPTPSPKSYPLGQNISREVEAICIKALEKNKDERFKTVEEMQEDIIQFIEKRTVKNINYSLGDKIQIYFKNYTKHAIALAILLVLSITSVIGIKVSDKIHINNKAINYINLGQSYFKNKNYEQALIKFHQALALDKNSKEAKDGLQKASEQLANKK